MDESYDAGYEAHEQDDDLFATPPLWPKVVGIISIVIGALFLGCVGCGIALQQFGQQIVATSMPGYQLPPMGIGPWILMGLSLVFNVVLIAGGIMLIQRSAAARLIHLFYSVGYIPLTLLGPIVNQSYKEQVDQSMRTWAEQNPNEAAAQAILQQPVGGGMAQHVGLIIGIVVGLAYPLFLLVWFGLAKRRHEDMTGGVDEAI